MAYFVKVPQKGLTEESVLLNKWYVNIGDEVKVGAYIFAVETQKAVFDVESEATGTVLEVLAEEGDEIPIKACICVIGEKGEQYSLPDEQ